MGGLKSLICEFLNVFNVQEISIQVGQVNQ